jgi:hypothetical protein
MPENDAKHAQTITDRATWLAIGQHSQNCPFTTLQIEPRVRALEITLARLIGFMLGSGAIGGILGGATAQLLK